MEHLLVRKAHLSFYKYLFYFVKYVRSSFYPKEILVKPLHMKGIDNITPYTKRHASKIKFRQAWQDAFPVIELSIFGLAPS